MEFIRKIYVRNTRLNNLGVSEEILKVTKSPKFNNVYKNPDIEIFLRINI